MGETSKNTWLDQYIGITNAPHDKVPNPCIFQENDKFTGVRFYLQAFSDYGKRPRFACRNQMGGLHIKHLNELFSQVLGTEIDAITPEEIREFIDQIERKWFVFEPSTNNGEVDGNPLPELPAELPKDVANIPFYTTINALEPPKEGNWENAVAVPIFSSDDSAMADWFSKERIVRSKLVIVRPEGGQMSVLFCESKGAEPQHRAIGNTEFSQNTHTFDEVPYVLMQRSLYVYLCNPNWDTPAERERRFLYHFQKTCENEGYLFNEKDLRNFHTSVKSGYLTILEGLSGTGKSSIVRLYKEAFGDNCKLCFLPVSPAWTDDAELLGYWDPRDKKYVHTELLDTLEEAQKNRNCLYLVCLDEMNLARVEHYFCRILSVMEKPLGERILHLHHDKANAENCLSVEIGDNVRFVGTVNVDDTTFSFADKVRDRANIISLQVENYRDNPFRTSKKQSNNGAPHDTGKRQSAFEAFVETYNGLTDTQEAELRKFLWSLHEILCGENRPFGVSPRTVKAIGTYLANYHYPENDGITLNTDALDFQVNQRILTKIHGSAELLQDLLTEYKPTAGDKNEASAELPNAENPLTPQAAEEKGKAADKKTLDQLLQEHGLQQSAKTLKRKRKELENYGYCP